MFHPYSFTFSRMSYKWKYMGHWCLASLSIKQWDSSKLWLLSSIPMHGLSIHLFKDSWVISSLGIMNRAAINIYAQIFVWTVFIFWGKCPWAEYGMLETHTLKFIRHCSLPEWLCHLCTPTTNVWFQHSALLAYIFFTHPNMYAVIFLHNLHLHFPND